jgi:ATP-dependent helicase/nuclease subunit A
MTRAEERLYVCGWETKTGPVEGSWHGLVRDALKDTAQKAETPAGEGLRLHHEVERIEPLREARLFDDQQTVLPAWARAFPDPEPVPARPLTPSQPLWREPPARSPLAPPPATGAASGVKRGFLVHRLLQALPELAPEEREHACRRFLARSVHGLAAEEQAAIARETLAVLADPEFAPLFAPESLAEVPIVGLVGDHALSGQIDRLVVTRDEVLIVDYKTLRPAPETAADIPEAYLRQLALYVAAVEKIWPDRPVRAALLWTDAPRLMPVPHAALAGRAP